MVNVDGIFLVEVFSVFVDGDYDVIVSVSDVVGNSMIVLDSGNINVSVLEIILDVFG